jgi:D-sedoheptulose 7-phosphate isomerase
MSRQERRIIESPGFESDTRAYLAAMRDVLDAVEPNQLARCAELLWRAWEEDRTIFIIGNGGSASTASHMACDLAKQTQMAGRRPLRAHSLTDNVALISALANDCDFVQVFSEQLRIHSRPGDVLISISASGNSPNVIAAVEEARRCGLDVIGFGGMDGGSMRQLCDLYVHAPAMSYGHVESAHLLFDHVLTHLLHEHSRRTSPAKPVVMVDRDGVILRNRPDYVKTRAEVDLIPGAIDALAHLSRAGHRVFVVTNQSAIGRGLITLQELNAIHSSLAAAVAQQGGRIEAFLVCPHHPDDGCDCRKPKAGLLFQARDRYRVELSSAYLIGDSETDMEAAEAAGCSGILVSFGHRTREHANGHSRFLAEDLRSAAALIAAASSSGTAEPFSELHSDAAQRAVS